MRANDGDSLESSLYLQFIATYELLSTINMEVILSFRVTSQHRQALQLCHTFGFADKIPDKFLKIWFSQCALSVALALLFFVSWYFI